jgi:hypothetical protein
MRWLVHPQGLRESLWKPVPLRYVLIPPLTLLVLTLGVLSLWALTRPVIVEGHFPSKPTVGDLEFDVIRVHNRLVFGLQGDRTDRRYLLYVIVQVKNLSQDHAVDWDGWQGKGVVEDLEGNKFKHADVTGWSPSPDTYSPDLDHVPVSRGAKIGPGEVYTSAAFFEPSAESPTWVILTYPVRSVYVRFREPIGYGPLVMCILEPRPQ